jgi:hypothetical protein
LNKSSKNCLIIFTRNPELGKGKRRLAATVGDETALNIYKFLLDHTRSITKDIDVEKQVWYSENVHENDAWDNNTYQKFKQEGLDLGKRMEFACKHALKEYENVIVIGSDMHDLSQANLEQAFEQLSQHDAVIGPAMDGGYYLLGFHKKLISGIFEDKEWGTDVVLEKTLANLKKVNFYKLEVRNDVDFYEDIKDIPAFQPLLKNYHAK